MGGKSSLERFPKETSSCRGIQNKVKSVVTSLRYYDNCDVNITPVITNFDLYLIQLWLLLLGSIVNDDVVYSQT